MNPRVLYCLVTCVALGVSACSRIGMPAEPPTPAGGGSEDRSARPADEGDRFGGDAAASVNPMASDDFDPMTVSDAEPRQEYKSRYGNMDEYEVFGRTYRVLDSSDGFEETGIASWYGPGFHGKATSSQEPYDQFKMTAAHKLLPLPTYVEVENLDNGRKVVVRVNDRGPFHDGRIIDLSYTAAYQLGVVERGTARVRIRALPPAAANREGN